MMFHRLPILLSVLAAAAIGFALPRRVAAAPIDVAEVKHEGDVDFEKEILPIFRRNCLACHSATEAQGDLVLESPQTILKGGSEGPAAVAGKSGESLLLTLASHAKEPFMPPPDNDVKAKPLTPHDLGLIKLWIDQGAKGELKAASSQIAWQPLPPGINPIYAVAVTPDGQYAAASRANQIFIYHVPSRRELGRLTDPSLLESGIYKQAGIADLDLIQSLKFSPDGTLLASGGFRTVKLWRKTIRGPQDDEAANASPVVAGTEVLIGDEKLRATASDEGTIRIVDVASGNVVKTLNHGSTVASIAVRSDGKRLASAGLGGSAKLWNLESGDQVAELKGDLYATLKTAEATRAAALAKKHVELAKKDLQEANDRKKAEEENQKKAAEALSKAEADLKLKEEAAKKAGEEKAAAEKSVGEAAAAKVKAEERQKAAAELVAKADEAIKSLKTNEEQTSKLMGDTATEAKRAAEKALADVEALRKLLEPQKESADKLFQEAASAVGKTEEKLKEVAAAHQKAIDDRTAAQRTLETAKRTAVRAAEAVKKAAEAIPSAEAVVKQLEEAAKKQEAAVAAAINVAKESERPIRAVAFSPEGSLVVTAGDDGRLHTWDSETGAAIEVYGNGPAAAIHAITFAPDGKAVTAGENGARSRWDLAVEWKLERTIGSSDLADVIVDRVTALDFSPDGKLLAVGSGEPSRSGEIKLFHVASGQLERTLPEPHSDTVNSLAFSPDGEQLASAAADRFAKLWNVADGKLIRALEGHTHHVLGIAWRADGRALVTSGADTVLKVWDSRTGEQLRTIQNQFTKEVTSVSFLADGELVIASGGDSRVRLISSANGNNQRDFSGPAEYMYAVAASADGKSIVAGGLDSVVRLWNEQAQEQAKFAAPKQADDRTAAK